MRKWVKALRSGKYDQDTSGELKNEFGYCCLGVAKEIGLCNAKKSNGDAKHWVSTKFIPYPTQESLANMNDSGKWSFNRIATYIEKNWKNL